jgi:hypothetical protein
LSPSFVHIAATSLELALKACLVEKLLKEKIIEIAETSGRKAITEEDIFAASIRPKYTHKLFDLAAAVELPLTKKEENFLKLLTESLVWEGRYPISKTYADYEKYHELINEVLYTPKSAEEQLFGEYDPEMIINIENYKKLWLKIEKYYYDSLIK